MLVVLDPNILISALLTPGGVARRVLQAGIAGRYELVLCPALIPEVEDVATRPKIAERIPDGAAAQFVADLRGSAHEELDPQTIETTSRDPADDYLVALAQAVHADHLVSGDADLLSLTDPPIPITILRNFAILLDQTD